MTLGAGPYDERDLAEKMADVGASLGGRLDADRAGFQCAPSPARANAIKRSTCWPQSWPRRASMLASWSGKGARHRRIAGVRDAPRVHRQQGLPGRDLRRPPLRAERSGEVETVAKLSRDDLVAFHRSYYRARNMVIAVMGDISRSDAAALRKSSPPACRPARRPHPSTRSGRQTKANSRSFPTMPRKAICSWAAWTEARGCRLLPPACGQLRPRRRRLRFAPDQGHPRPQGPGL